MACVIGIDVGTEGTKAVVVDEKGRIRQKATVSYKFDVPRSGWAEQDPEVWWDAVVTCLHRLWNQGILSSDIVCIGISGQMHSAVLLDRDGMNVRKSILWNDIRSKGLCDEVLHSIGPDRYLGETCNSLLPGFTLGKLLWVHRNEPELYRHIAKVLMPKDFINYRLTNCFSADVSDASGTGLFDVRCRKWHEELIHEFHLPRDWFPRVYESGDIIGEITVEAAGITGLRPGTPVIAGAADNAAAAVGMGIVSRERGLVSVGTSGVVLSCLERAPSYQQAKKQNPTLHVFCHAVPETWYGMGVTLAAGASLRWFRDSLGQGLSYDELMEQAALVEMGSSGLVYLPFLTGERTPYNSDQLRAGFFGIHLLHTMPHFVRAVIEGVSYSLRDCLELIKEMPADVEEFVVTGGVVNSDVWLQILTDVFGVPLTTYEFSEGAAYGVGILAGLSQGFWNHIHQILPQNGEARKFIPTTGRAVYESGYDLYKKYAEAQLKK